MAPSMPVHGGDGVPTSRLRPFRAFPRPRNHSHPGALERVRGHVQRALQTRGQQDSRPGRPETGGCGGWMWMGRAMCGVRSKTQSTHRAYVDRTQSMGARPGPGHKTPRQAGERMRDAARLCIAATDLLGFAGTQNTWEPGGQCCAVTRVNLKSGLRSAASS
jgi:hypothetical protein